MSDNAARVQSVFSAADSGFLAAPIFANHLEKFTHQFAQTEDPAPQVKAGADHTGQLLGDTYARGYQDGLQAAQTKLRDEKHGRDALAHAIEALAEIHSEKLSALLVDTVRDLLVECLGEGACDEGLLCERATGMAALIDAKLGAPCLHVSPQDYRFAALLPIECKADPDLLPGSLRLTHAGGEIAAGSIAVLRSMEQNTVDRNT